MQLSEVHGLQVPRRFPRRSSEVGRGLYLQNGNWRNFTFCMGPWQGGSLRWISLNGHPFLALEAAEDDLVGARSQSDSHQICAPVPGKVVKVMMTEGDELQERQVVLILESMKMEFEVLASRQGRIRKILVQNGQQVQADELLAEWHNDAQ